jgi:trehalose 6-phosphate synthase/phosphatase
MLGVFPMGIDAEHFAMLARDPEVEAQAAVIRRDAGERQIVLGVDRLDYTKGIPRRLHAIERLLTREPALRDRVRYVQVAVPSRSEVDSYQKFKRQVEEAVGRINGACGTLRSTPLQYVHRSVSERELVALYSAADVMLVTPLRDGMNLVAKEFVASRVSDDGVLVLSEFAGAAAELDGAVVVNPYDVDAVASAVQHALVMSAPERRARMQQLRRRVADADIHAWAQGFIDRLHELRPAVDTAALAAPPLGLAAALAEARRTSRLRILLDYDGTLVPLVRAPELAAPDDALLALLAELADAPGLDVEIVSGRPRGTLDAWLGHLPIALWAEHGFWHRHAPDGEWKAATSIRSDWADRILPILQQFTAATPGSAVEMKTASIAWHFRGANRDFGLRQAHELRMLLGDALSNQPIEVLEGKKVIEIRVSGISKAIVAEADVPAPHVVVAFGDDQTDADLFRVLPPPSITVAVGDSLRLGRYRVADFRDVRRLLQLLLGESPGVAEIVAHGIAS